MQKRLGAFAIRMGLTPQPCQVPPQLVVLTFNVVRMGLACRVLLSFKNAPIGPVMICAVLNVPRI